VSEDGVHPRVLENETQFARFEVHVEIDHRGLKGGGRKVHLDDVMAVGAEDGDPRVPGHASREHEARRVSCPLVHLLVREQPCGLLSGFGDLDVHAADLPPPDPRGL